MGKPEWGSKHRCHKCGTRFYDLERDPIVCPSCEAEHVPDVILKSRVPQPVEDAPKPKKQVAGKDDDEDVEIEDDVDIDEDDDVALDDLDDDDDVDLADDEAEEV